MQHLTLKTYSRKRKSSEMAQTEATPSPSKKTVPSTQNVIKSVQSHATPVYMTKSSRVIKKKVGHNVCFCKKFGKTRVLQVIWDPDESSPKLKLNKPEGGSKNEAKPADFAKKSAVDIKSKPDKKGQCVGTFLVVI